MARPKEKDATLNPLVATAIGNLFGSVRHALQVLELEPEGISYQVLREALLGNPLREEEVDLISLAWRQWSNRYLKEPERMTFRRTT